VTQIVTAAHRDL